jgi:hypothetical protein
MSQTTCGDVTVSETESVSPNDVQLANCSLSDQSITAGDTLTATVEATNTLQTVPVNIEVQMTAPRAVGSLPSATATLEGGETVRVEGEVQGNTLGVSSDPFSIGWEVVSVSSAVEIPDPVDPGDPVLEPTQPVEGGGGFQTEPVQLSPDSL